MKRLFLSIMTVTLLLLLSFGSVMAANSDTSAISTSLTGQRGQSVSLDLCLNNPDSQDHTWSISADSPINNYHPVLMLDGLAVSEIQIPAGQAVNVTLTLDIPADHPEGNTALTADFTDENQTLYSYYFWLNVSNDYGLTVSNQLNNLTATSGQSFNIQIDLTNTGALKQEDISLDFGLPSKWVVENITPQKMSLNAQESGSFDVQIFVPSTQAAGTSKIDVTGTSAYGQSETVTIPVDVKSSSSFGIIALILIVISIIVTFVFFKKYGRR
ncbi:hypothetical protein Q5O14_03120 [Eubacteriaceae bacterium ES2]|nr:hypothetical protein Q5O14_03120 [Eubacteriaceae bacterium ES2]